MTTSSFNRPGAVDLSRLTEAAKARSAPAGGAAGRGARPGGASYVVEVDEASFESVLGGSMQYPVVLEFFSGRVSGGQQLSDALASVANAAGGKVLVARIDTDRNARLVQALQQQGVPLQAVPTVLGVLSGQLFPGFQGVVPVEQVQQFVDQLVSAAVANGVVGRAEPVAGAEGEPEPEETEDRFAAADALLEQGDFAGARTEFERMVTADPSDAEAKAGLAQVGLLDRASRLDPNTVAAAVAQPDAPLSAQLDAADLAMVSGDAQSAFDRLLAVVRATSGDDRETVRLRLLELFETLGNADDRVVKARRALMTALF